MDCVKCNRSIISDENYYIASDLGPEILFIIEQHMAHEIAADATLCDACFISVSKLLESTCNSPELIKDTIESVSGTYETNECVWCLVRIVRKRTHYLSNGPQRDAISIIIAPRQVPDGSLVCHRCWTRACRLVGVSASNCGQSQHNCVWCRLPLSRRRTHNIPPGPERNEITAQIAPRQILPGDRVCYACWVSARRKVQRATNLHPTTTTTATITRNICIVCSTTVRSRTHQLLIGPVRDAIARRIYPRQVKRSDRVCQACWDLAQSPHVDNQKRLLGQHNVCLCCGRSLASRINHLLHTNSIRESRIYNVIQEWIIPRTIQATSRVCQTCWVSADGAADSMVPDLISHQKSEVAIS